MLGLLHPLSLHGRTPAGRCHDCGLRSSRARHGKAISRGGGDVLATLTGPGIWLKPPLEDTRAGATLEEWIRQERDAGREEEAQLHEQVAVAVGGGQGDAQTGGLEAQIDLEHASQMLEHLQSDLRNCSRDRGTGKQRIRVME